jgi:hypothetical protein
MTPIRPRPTATRSRLRSTWEFGQALAPEELADVEQTRVAFNLQRARTILPAALLLTATALALLHRVAPDGSAAYRLWRSNAFALGYVFFAVTALGLVALHAWPSFAPRVAALHGPFMVLWGAVAAANLQRIRPAFDFFLITSLCLVFLYRPRLLHTVGAQVIAGVVAAAGVLALQPDRGMVQMLLLVDVALCLTVIVVGRSNLVMLARDVVARRVIDAQRAQLAAQGRELAALNQSLEERVDAQVAVIVRRSREVEQLNAALRERVDQSARDLSALLQRMTQGEGAPGIAPGTVVNERFAVAELLAAGGMGEVYRATDQRTGEAVVLKVIAAASAHEVEAMQRVLREARASVRVEHPAVVSALHVDVGEGRLFAVFPFIEGITLDRLIQRAEPFAVGRAVRIAHELADALAAAHATGVIHRDVKPGNVMITPATDRVWLLDFGIASLYEADASWGRETREGATLGTPAYMAPEQVMEAASAGDRADVYAVGIVLFELLAGRHPFAGNSPRALLLAQVSHPPPALRALVTPAVPTALCDLVHRCLEKTPPRRPAARELRDALAAIADALPDPHAPASAPRPAPHILDAPTLAEGG